MAYGTELILGLDPKKVLSKYLEEPLTAEEIDELDGYEFIELIKPAIQNELQQVYLKLVQTHIDPAAVIGSRGYIKITHEGETRELGAFYVGVVDDEGHNPVFGISLISRYFPNWLDWEKKHGGSGDPIVLDSNTLQQIDLARQAIAPVIPEILYAPITLALVHY